MTCAEKWNLIINALIAFGTIAAVVVALFYDWFKNQFLRAKISVELLSNKGELTAWQSGRRVIYYHLKIKNSRSSIVVQKCRVLLKGIRKKNSDNSYTELPLAVPTAFQWAPASTAPQILDFITEQILDFGFIEEGSEEFKPAVNPVWKNFRGYLKRNETFIYQLELLANNSKPQKLSVEVFWDGKWNDNLEVMANSLKIRIL